MKALRLIALTFLFMVLVVVFLRPGVSKAETPKDPWTTDYVTGVVAIEYQNDVQTFIFVGKDGHVLVASAQACGEFPKCGPLVAKLRQQKHAALVNLDKPGAQL